MTEQRLCPRCGETKPLTKEFWHPCNRRGRAEFQYRCKICNAVDMLDHKVATYAKIVAIKEALPCMDCGVSYPACVMDFDHRPGTGKHRDVSHMMSCTWERILEEIAKCDLICANCHRLRTWKRGRGVAA